jgi:hypothetical protein
MYFWLELISLQFLKAVLGVGEFRRGDSISGYWSAAGMAVGLTPVCAGATVPDHLVGLHPWGRVANWRFLEAEQE